MVKEITKSLVMDMIPKREPEVYKGSFQKILCVGGNQQMGGAIILSSAAALHAGAGLVTVATCSENRSALHSRSPECLFVNMNQSEELAKAVQENEIILLGPGLGRNEQSRSIFEQVIQQITDQQLIIDADGLYWLAKFKNDFSHMSKQPILTPHLGEWQNLTQISPPANDHQKNLTAQQSLGAYIILKKHRTEILGFNNIWKNTTGNPSMATGGMGDVLAGVLASLISQTTKLEDGLISAVYVHSYAADLLAKKQYVTLPSHVTEKIPFVMKQLTELEEEI